MDHQTGDNYFWVKTNINTALKYQECEVINCSNDVQYRTRAITWTVHMAPMQSQREERLCGGSRIMLGSRTEESTLYLHKYISNVDTQPWQPHRITSQQWFFVTGSRIFAVIWIFSKSKGLFIFPQGFQTFQKWYRHVLARSRPPRLQQKVGVKHRFLVEHVWKTCAGPPEMQPWGSSARCWWQMVRLFETICFRASVRVKFCLCTCLKCIPVSWRAVIDLPLPHPVFFLIRDDSHCCYGHVPPSHRGECVCFSKSPPLLSQSLLGTAECIGFTTAPIFI